MILFFDIVSPLPEFSLIEDNKIIYSKNLFTNSNEKMSDCILPAYIELNKKFSLDKRLKFLITNTGPGSFTALRIGIAFLSGLSLATNITLIGVSCTDLFRYAIKKEQLSSSAIYISSSNNQKFICMYDLKKDEYKITKIEKQNNTLELNKLFFKTIFTNSALPLNQINFIKDVEYKKINFNELINHNIKKIISLPKKDIIEPIYISNNKILN